MRNFRISNLQWGAGILSAFIGTLLLISPHRFTSLQEWAFLKDSLVIFGYALLISGCVLLSIPIMAPSSQVITLTHLMTSGLLAFFALSLLKSFQPGLGWIIPLNLIMIVVGLLIALVMPQTYQTIQPQRDSKRIPPQGGFIHLLIRQQHSSRRAGHHCAVNDLSRLDYSGGSKTIHLVVCLPADTVRVDPHSHSIGRHSPPSAGKKILGALHVGIAPVCRGCLLDRAAAPQ